MRYVELLRHTDNEGTSSPRRESRLPRRSDATGWRTSAKAAGKGSDVEAIRKVDPDLVEQESALLGGALRGLFDALPEGGRALVVGHSPTSEAAVLGLTGAVVGPLGKGDGVLIIEDGERFEVRPIEENPHG